MAKLTIYNVAICLTVGWGGYSYGFGFAVFVSSLGQPSFYEYFKLDRKGSLSLLLNATDNHQQLVTILQSKSIPHLFDPLSNSPLA